MVKRNRYIRIFRRIAFYNLLCNSLIKHKLRYSQVIRQTPEMVASMLGVLKTGAAYLPLDPEFPADRISYMLEDAKPSCIITTEEIAASLPDNLAVMDSRKLLKLFCVTTTPFGLPVDPEV